MSSICCSADVVQLYEMGLNNENIFITIVAQNELERRGNYDYIHEKLTEYIKNGKMKLGTEFTHLISESLVRMREVDPYLARVGKSIKIKTHDQPTGVFSVEDVKLDPLTDEESRRFSDTLAYLFDCGCAENTLKDLVGNYYANQMRKTVDIDDYRQKKA